MEMNAGSGLKRVTSIIRRFTDRHPILTVILGLFLAITAANRFFDYKAEAHRNSPEGQAEAASAEQRIAEEAKVEVAEVLVKSRLRDPESAQFLGSRVVYRDGKSAVCGSVNSRNGFGGMAGSEAFVVSDAVVRLTSDGRAGDALMRKFCN